MFLLRQISPSPSIATSMTRSLYYLIGLPLACNIARNCHARRSIAFISRQSINIDQLTTYIISFLNLCAANTIITPDLGGFSSTFPPSSLPLFIIMHNQRHSTLPFINSLLLCKYHQQLHQSLFALIACFISLNSWRVS